MVNSLKRLFTFQAVASTATMWRSQKKKAKSQQILKSWTNLRKIQNPLRIGREGWVLKISSTCLKMLPPELNLLVLYKTFTIFNNLLDGAEIMYCWVIKQTEKFQLVHKNYHHRQTNYGNYSKTNTDSIGFVLVDYPTTVFSSTNWFQTGILRNRLLEAG